MSELSVVFGHDHTFRSDLNGRFYSGGGLPASVWKRYLKFFSRITVIGRNGGFIQNMVDTEKMALSSCEGVNFCLVENISTVKSKLYGNASLFVKIQKLVSEHDAVIARLSSEIGLILIREARKQSKPYAIELVDCPWDAYWNYGGVKAKLYAPWLMFQVRSALRSSKYSLYVTHEFLQSRYPSPNAVTVDCSNVQLPEPDVAVLDARFARIRSRGNEVTFGLIGSLHGKLKGIDIVLRALTLAKDKIGPFEFRVLGSGDSAWLVKLAQDLGIADRVHFDGLLPSGKPVFDWLDRVDIYLHPSYKEGLPRALVEALSRGCPAIATSVGGTPELLPADYLVRPGDYKSLSHKLIELALSKDAQHSQADQNFQQSRRYAASALDQKRNDFWQAFAQCVIAQKTLRD